MPAGNNERIEQAQNPLLIAKVRAYNYSEPKGQRGLFVEET
jgi:hypothetical protein